MFPDKAAQLQQGLGRMLPLKSFDLVGEEAADNGKRRIYRVAFERVVFKVTFVVTPEDKIASLILRPE
jgi:hypothetical protein